MQFELFSEANFDMNILPMSSAIAQDFDIKAQELSMSVRLIFVNL